MSDGRTGGVFNIVPLFYLISKFAHALEHCIHGNKVLVNLAPKSRNMIFSMPIFPLFLKK
jgi:hypothetical protein